MIQKIAFIIFFCHAIGTVYSCSSNHQISQVLQLKKNLGHPTEKNDDKKETNSIGISDSLKKEKELNRTVDANAQISQEFNTAFTNIDSYQQRGIGVRNSLSFQLSGHQIYDQMIAVIIGIDRYQNLGVDEQLNYAVHDARGVAALLKDKYSFNTITLYNENATRSQIMKILQGDLAETGSNDAVLIYFAGHGITKKTHQGMLGYLLPSDGSTKRNEMHKNISMQQIKSDICPLIQAKHVLIIADACFGGLLLSTRATHPNSSYDLSYLKEITNERVRQIITAGAENERVLDEGQDGHSVFTGRLIEKLKQVDRYITANQLGEDLKQKVYSDAIERGHTQRPNVGKIYGIGDFVFIPDVAKKQQAITDEVRQLQSEIQHLKKLEVSARQLVSQAKLRELERERLLKQARLKHAQLKQDAAEREAQLRKKVLAENQRQMAIVEKQKQQQASQLVMLKQQAEQLRKQVGNPASALGMDDAVNEIKEINQTIQKLETNFSEEKERQVQPVRQIYESQLSSIREQRNQPKSMYETENDYQKRLADFDKQLSEVQKEMKQKITDIRQKIDNELIPQKKNF